MKTTIGLAVALVGAVSGTATSPDGIPIRYHAAGKGDPALVFVHCGGCERGFWDGRSAATSAGSAGANRTRVALERARSKEAALRGARPQDAACE
jgi:hypothetical protein